MNGFTFIKGIIFIIKYLPTKKTVGLDIFTGELNQKLNKEILTLSENGGGNIPNLFYKADITLIIKSGKNIMKEETKRPKPF